MRQANNVCVCVCVCACVRACVRACVCVCVQPYIMYIMHIHTPKYCLNLNKRYAICAETGRCVRYDEVVSGAMVYQPRWIPFDDLTLKASKCVVESSIQYTQKYVSTQNIC